MTFAKYRRAMKAKMLAALSGVMCFFCVGFSPALASPPSVQEDARNRITLAGRQRMLSQEIARNACFVKADIEPARFADKTLSAVRQFENVRSALRAGDELLRLLPERDTAVINQITSGDDLWAELSPAAQQIASGDLHSVPMQQLILLNLAVLDHMDRSTGLIVQTYAKTAIDKDLADTLNLASQQLMWSQRASKELCFLSLGINASQNRTYLLASLDAFEAAMVQLLEGDAANNIMKPPNSRLKRQLGRVNKVWKDLAILMRTAVDEPNLDAGERVKLANLSNHILLEMTLAVTMYSQI